MKESSLGTIGVVQVEKKKYQEYDRKVIRMHTAILHMYIVYCTIMYVYVYIYSQTGVSSFPGLISVARVNE